MSNIVITYRIFVFTRNLGLAPSLKTPYRHNCLLVVLLGIFMCLMAFSHATLATEPKVSDNFPDYDAMAGEGILTQTLPVEGVSTIEASLVPISNINIGNEKLCHGLTLKTQTTEIMSILTCDSGKIIFCPNEIKYCGDDFLSPTKKKKQILERRSLSNSDKYSVEFLPDGLIYRELEKNCLIPYPHGCIVPGFGWHDYKKYEFHKK